MIIQMNFMHRDESIRNITIIICKFCGQVQCIVQHGYTNNFYTNRLKLKAKTQV